MREEVFGRGVFVKASHEVGDGGVEILPAHDGRVEEDGRVAFFKNTGLIVGHTFEHFQFDAVFDSVSGAEQEGVGDVEEIVGSDADANGCGVFRMAGVVEHSFEIGIDVGFVGIGCLWPVVQGGFDFFHGEIGSFDNADLNGSLAGFGPFGEFFEGLIGVGEISLQDDASFEGLELLFVESAAEGFAREVKVAVFLHVEIDELPGAVEFSESFLDGGESAFFIKEIDLGKDGGDFYREVSALGLAEESEVFLEAVFGFFLAKDGFSEEVEIDAIPGGEVAGELVVFAGENDALGIAGDLGGDGGHHELREEVGGQGAHAHHDFLMWLEVGRDAVPCDELAKDPGLGVGRGRTEHFVGEMEGEFLSGGVGEEAGHLVSLAFFDWSPGRAGGGEEFGGQGAGFVNEPGGDRIAGDFRMR